MIKCNERKILCFLLFEFGERGNKGWNGRHAAVGNLGNPTSEGQAGESRREGPTMGKRRGEEMRRGERDGQNCATSERYVVVPGNPTSEGQAGERERGAHDGQEEGRWSKLRGSKFLRDMVCLVKQFSILLRTRIPV